MSLNKYKIRVIANTSFNISSDPMVYDKEDAFLAVERMGIKYLLKLVYIKENEDFSLIFHLLGFRKIPVPQFIVFLFLFLILMIIGVIAVVKAIIPLHT